MDSTAKKWLRKQTVFANRHFSFKDCGYYPCHIIPEGQEGLNCFFCYCPFYPCGNKIGTGKWIKDRDGKRVWDCEDCITVHSDAVAIRIQELLFEGVNWNKIKTIIRKEFKNGRIDHEK